jgi:hypothetical protein
MSAMKGYLSFMAACLLAGCTTLPPLSEGVTLSVRSYDRATGDYMLELRNETARPVLYLNPYLNFDAIRRPDPEPFPEGLAGMAFMVHSTKLAAGGSVVLSGKCTAGGLCSRPETYVAVRACWFAKAWNCEQYFPIWSKTPLTGV